MTNMTSLDTLVLAEYKRIHALPFHEMVAELEQYWAKLSRECRKDSPCVECQRDVEALEEYGYREDGWEE